MKNSPKSNAKISSERTIKKKLVLINDDYNTFNHVVECLISLCDHSHIQAEQCALLTHYKGSCELLIGKQSDLELIRDDLMIYDLNVEII